VNEWVAQFACTETETEIGTSQSAQTILLALVGRPAAQRTIHGSNPRLALYGC
jgi:hypothetical protein